MAQTKRKQVKPEARSESSRKPSHKWQLQTAKAQFSELFRRARTEGPQHVTRAGKEEVVIVSKEEFDKMSGLKQKETLWEFFRNSPLRDSGIDLERRRDYPRKVEL
jgi:prevent-host-death family protein